jgi:DNA replication ATP-dependent helicase Dna2
MPSDSLAGLFAAKALQDHLIDFVRSEHNAQREALNRILSLPTEQRVEEGRCIVGLQVDRHGARGSVRFTCGANDSRFREGDFVRISRGDPKSFLAQATIVHAEDYWVEVQLWNAAAETFPPGSRDLQIDESFFDLEDQYLAALEELGKTERGRAQILPLLLGERLPQLDPGLHESTLAAAGADGFDDAQSEAVAGALASDLCWLVHGPPGTGKTRVLAWIAAQLLEKGERILVTALTHRAINNLLEAIAERIGDQRRIAKITHFPDPSLTLPQYESFSKCPFRDDASGGYIIGATPFAARSRRLREAEFDTCLIDEASQITLPLAVMAMLSGKRYVFAGDHKQLPPVTHTLSAADAADMSIFQKLQGRSFDTLLPVTHRLNDALCEWPSSSFYLSRLRSHPSAASRRLDLSSAPTQWSAVLARDPSVVWVAVPHEGAKTWSPEEAHATSELLDALHAGGVRASEIGVVVPFRRQARMVRQLLAKRTAQGLTPAVIDTVERMQGQEREVIIVSFTASDALFVSRVGEFLFQPQRLNVAATRARRKLILLASPTLLEIARSFSDADATADFVSLLDEATRMELPPR